MSVAAAANRPSGYFFGLSPDRLFVVLSRLGALTALVVVLSILSPHFLTWNNLVNVLRHAVPLFIMSAGLTLVVLTAGIDLSVGAVLGLAACLAGSLIAGGHAGLGIAAAIGTAIILSESARADGHRRYRRSSYCGDLLYRCEDGSRWACRRYEDRCY